MDSYGCWRFARTRGELAGQKQARARLPHAGAGRCRGAPGSAAGATEVWGESPLNCTPGPSHRPPSGTWRWVSGPSQPQRRGTEAARSRESVGAGPRPPQQLPHLCTIVRGAGFPSGGLSAARAPQDGGSTPVLYTRGTGDTRPSPTSRGVTACPLGDGLAVILSRLTALSWLEEPSSHR